MFIAKTSFRAFLIAMLPVLFVQSVLFAMALLGTQTNPPMIAMPSPDRALGALALRVMFDAAGFAIGHFVCRGIGLGSRIGYSIMGGMAAAAAYALVVQQGVMLLPPTEDAVVSAGILPVLAGMIAGLVYVQLAGREPARTGEVEAVPQSEPQSLQRFTGPIQVRTSIGAMALSSFVPAFLIAVLFFMLSYGLVSGVNDDIGKPLRIEAGRQIVAFAIPAQMFLTTAIVTTIPSAIFVAVAHGIARALRQTSGISYVSIGALTGLGFGVALIPFGGWPAFPFTGVGFLILPLAVFGAIMMAVYRRFAGIEPQMLPEPVLATDLEALVPEDHPARRSHTVVLNG